MINAPNFIGQSIQWTFFVIFERNLEGSAHHVISPSVKSHWKRTEFILWIPIIISLIIKMIKFYLQDHLYLYNAHIWWEWSAGEWPAGFSLTLHGPTSPRFPVRGKKFPLNSQKRGRTLRPGRQRRHTGAGSPWVRRRRGEGSNGSPGTQEAPG